MRRSKKIKVKKLKSKLPKTVQQTIPFKDMRKDGICMVEDDYFTKTIMFTDINYELAGDSEKENIFRRYCELLNSFDSDVDFQFTYQTKTIDVKKSKEDIRLPDIDFENDDINAMQREYQQMLNDVFDKCSSGVKKVKYLTFGVHESDFKKAVIKLERVESEIRRKFKKMCVYTHILDGSERLKLLKESLHPLDVVPFNFDWETRLRGVSVKDSISPSSMDFSKIDSYRIGRTIGRSYYVLIDSAEISDRFIEELMSVQGNVAVTIHTHSENLHDALKFTGNKLTAANGIKVGQQRKAAQGGYDGDILSMNLVDEINSAENVYNAIAKKNQRMFTTTLSVNVYGRNISQINAVESDLTAVTQKYHCELKVMDDLQEEGAMSALPLGINTVPIDRLFITTELAAFIPFTSQDVFTPHSTYYGYNPITKRMILIKRIALKNLGGIILGVSGSGKSFFIKREIFDVFLRNPEDYIIICEPEDEYSEITKTLGGEIIDISASSKNYINPFDINFESDDEDPIAVKAQFILSFIEAGIGGKYGLDSDEKSVIDRCLKNIYERYMLDPVPEKMPVFEDLYNELRKQKDNEKAKYIADSIEIFVTGSLSIFNHRTNVEVDNRIICFNIKNLSKHLHNMGMLVIMDYVWNRVSKARNENRYTHFYIDEFHGLLKSEFTAAYCVDMWKRFRKWRALPTGITQNITDFLASPQTENIFKNSAFVVLMGQAAGDSEILAARLNISPQEMEYLKESSVGEGLIYFDDKTSGSTIVPFRDSFPKNTLAYKMMSTDYEG